ncbi:MAG: ATP-binding protein [Chloroflexia bacterium]
MADVRRSPIFQLPIRSRLTLWYVLLMALTLALFSGYLLFRLQSSLMDSVDAALQIAVSQTIPIIDNEIGVLTLQESEEAQSNSQQFTDPNFALRLMSPQGDVWDTTGAYRSVPAWGPTEPGYSTQVFPDDDEQWRIYSQPVLDPKGQVAGWVQAAQSLENVKDTLEAFRAQLLLGIPLVLLLAGIGGYFLANRALRPIDHITRTAQITGAGDLSRRIAYVGAADEVGRLARTFDQMLERLEDSFERERRFSGDAAHELRTPLTALKGQIEVALNRPRSLPEYENTLRGLSLQVDRLIRLSNALLFLSRSDQNRLSWEPALLNLGDLLAAIIEQIQPLAQEKGLTLSADIPPELPFYGDTDHLVRLFLNLLDNAVKYTPEGGEIHVLAEQDADGVEVKIHNSAPDISTEHLPYVFDRFYRVESDRSSETGGTGLGLAIAREVARLHHGDISVQSEPGQGTTFIVSLPAATEKGSK